MSWNDLQKARESQGSFGSFISLKDGEFIEGVFVGEPKMFYSIFKDPEEYTSWAKGRSFKFKINMIIKDENGKLVAKILKGGAEMRDQLLDCIKEYGLDCLFKVKRTGSGKDDTRYSILFKAKLTPEQDAAVKAITPLSLEPQSAANKGDNEPPPLDDSDLPF